MSYVATCSKMEHVRLLPQIDLPILYESRHEEINESQVVMETMRLIPFFNRLNDLVSLMNQAHINYMFEHLSDKDKTAVLADSNL